MWFVVGILIGVVITGIVIKNPAIKVSTENIGEVIEYRYGTISNQKFGQYLSTIHEKDIEKVKIEVQKRNARNFINDEKPETLVKIYYKEVN